MSGVEKLAIELPNRSDWREVITIRIDDSDGVILNINRPLFSVYHKHNHLYVTSIVPGWGFGWKSVFKDRSVYEILSWLMHYARQYIHRSNVASALMTAWDKHGKVLHPFGSQQDFQQYGVLEKTPSAKIMLTRAIAAGDSYPPEQSSHATRSRWNSANLLDPNIHQAIFHFLRGQKLLSENFYVESIVAMDCSVQAIGAFLIDTHKGINLSTRRDIGGFFQMTNDEGDIFEYSYFLRNNFGAHAGGWRWWDYGEMINGQYFEFYSKTVRKLILQAIEHEKRNRNIDPHPSDWGEWFFMNFKVIWDSVWFEKYAKWSVK